MGVRHSFRAIHQNTLWSSVALPTKLPTGSKNMTPDSVTGRETIRYHQPYVSAKGRSGAILGAGSSDSSRPREKVPLSVKSDQ